MYPVRQHQPYAGFRYFLVENYCLSYAVAEDTVIFLPYSLLVGAPEHRLDLCLWGARDG